MSLHSWSCQGTLKPSNCATFTLNFTGAELPQAKKFLHLYMLGCFGSVLLFTTLWTVACQASLSGSGVHQARILEHIGPYWLPYPSRALYFLLP